MSAKRLIVSLIYGIVIGFGFMALTGSYVESVYIAPRFAIEGLGPVFNFFILGFCVGISGFIMGLFGKLPGTKLLVQTFI